MPGATQNLPSMEGVGAAGTNASNGLGGFIEVLGSLTGSGGGSSPLSAVTTALGDLGDKLNIDVSGISERLPQAITTIQNALPDDALKYVEDIQEAYQALMEFLQNSELVKQIQEGQSLEQVALALVNDVLSLFTSRLGDLAANLVGADELTRVRSALQLIEDLRDDPAGHAAELIPFLSQNLLGVPQDLLQGATAQVGTALAVLEPLSDGNLAGAVTPARAAIAVAFKDVAQAVKDFDPANLPGYAALEAQLGTLQGAIDSGFSALQTFYSATQTVVNSHAWETIFTTYRDLLQAIPLDRIPTVDDAVNEIAGVLDDLLARLTMALSPEDLAASITRLSDRFQETFQQSPLGQVRQAITGFLEQIRQWIEDVPTEEVQAAVQQMLERIGQELDSLGISTIRTSIEGAFQEAQDFIDQHLGSGLVDEVRPALQGVLDQLNQIPIAEVGQQLTEAVNSIGTVITDLQAQLQSGLEEIQGYLAQLDELSFRPVADEVIEEIQAIKQKLQAMSPQSLSDAEKLAIQGALAILKAIDLEGMINTQLKNGFSALADQLQQVVDQILAAWLDFRRRLGDFDPQVVMGPVGEILGQVTQLVERLNARAVMAPLYDLVDSLRERLTALSPGSLLLVLQGPYDQMMEVVNRINPDVWVQPLRDLYTQIDRFLGYVDITPLLDTLETKERELFAQARQAITDGLDSVNLPPPLDVFYGQIKTLTLTISDAIFGDPEEGLRDFNVTMGNSVSLSTLFMPLDLAFDKLLQALDAVPREDLVGALEGLRSGMGMALKAMDPRAMVARLRDGQEKLAGLSPAMAAAAIPALPSVRVSLAARLQAAPPENQAAATSLLARFDLVLAPIRLDVDDSAIRQLQASHEALVESFRQKINALDATGAAAAYTSLDANLSRVLPAFLRQPTPLTYDQVRAGLAELRPSAKAARLDRSLSLFLARLKPLEGAINPAMNGFFRVIKESVLLIHPGTIKASVQSIYDTLREKLHILDPEELAQSLRENIYEPLLEPLDAINPATIGQQLDGLYQGVLTALSGTIQAILDQIRVELDQLLGQVRAAVSSILGALTAQLQQILENLQQTLSTLDNLVVDDLFGRLKRVIENLEVSFGEELDRVQNEFDAMLNAVPGGSGGSSASAGVST